MLWVTSSLGYPDSVSFFGPRRDLIKTSHNHIIIIIAVIQQRPDTITPLSLSSPHRALVSMDAIAQFVACLAVAALVIMQHRRFTEVEERLAAISRALEQSLAETQQVHKIQAFSTHVSGRLGQIDAKLERLEKIRELMRTFTTHVSDRLAKLDRFEKIPELMRTFTTHMSDRLGQIDAKLERFERELCAPRSADCAHQEFEDDCFEGDFEQDKVETWLATATATRAKQEEQGSSSETNRQAIGSASTRNDSLTSAQVAMRPTKIMNPRHGVCRHDVLEAGNAPSSACMIVQNFPLAPDPRVKRKFSREWRSDGAFPSVAEEHKPSSSMLTPGVSRSSKSLPPSASSGTLTRAKHMRDHQKSMKSDLGDGRRFDSNEAGRLPPAAPPNTPLYR